MDPIQPVWADAAQSFVRHISDGIENLIPADPQNRDYAALIASDVEIAAYQPPAQQVPEGVLRHQGLIALLGIGITEQAVLSRIAAIEDAAARELTRLRFYQPAWRRGGPLLDWLSGEFSLPPQDVDALLVAAALA